MKNLFLAVLVVSGMANSYACDVCGCGSMVLGLDDLSLSNRHYLGLSYNLRQFKRGDISDYYHQLSLEALFSISDRWQLKASIPYLLLDHGSTETENSKLSGLGDPTLMFRYLPIIKIGKKSVHMLALSAGINFPLGKYQYRINSELPPNLQIGTGSWDFLSQLQYQMQYKKWSLGLQAAYLNNTTNKYNYTFGDQYTAQLSAALNIYETQKLILMPGLAFRAEHFDRDINSRNYYQYGTGGDGLLGMISFKAVAGKWMLISKAGSNFLGLNDADYQPALQFQFAMNYLF